MSTQTHPIVLVAATAVTVASLAVVASVAGWLPGSSKEAPPAVVAAAPENAPNTTPPAISTPPAGNAEASPRPPVQITPRNAPRHAERKAAPTTAGESGHDTASHQAPPPVAVQTPAAQAPQAPTCRDCGTIESVRSVTPPAQGSGLGAVAGGVLGGLVGNQIGGGSGRDLSTIAGAVGGAFAGNEVEKRVRTETKTEVTVRFDDGSKRTLVLGNTSRWQRGDRVRLIDGRLEAY